LGTRVDAGPGAVARGLLRTDDELIRDIFAELPFERLGSRIRERLRNVAQGVRRG